MLAFGGGAVNPMTTEELESLPNPGDAASVAIAGATVGTLEASLQSPYLPEPPSPVEENSQAAVDDAPAPDDDNFSLDGEASAVVDAGTSSALPAAPLDMMARASQELDRQTVEIGASKPAEHPPLVSMVVCAKAARELKAMSCSLVTQISGYPEGCECRMKAKKCPAVRKDLGFTGLSPSLPLSPPQLGGTTVILCMYWQWLKPVDRSKENQLVAEQSKEMAIKLVEGAHKNAEWGAKFTAGIYYGMTPPPLLVTTTIPIPATPAPIYYPMRILSTTPLMPFFPAMWGPMPGPAPAPMPAPVFAYNPFVDAMSALVSPVTAGTNVLNVQSNMGFRAGRQITIDQGLPTQEVHTIAPGGGIFLEVAFGPIFLTTPMRFNHPAGASVVMPKVTGPAPGPAPGPAAGFFPGPVSILASNVQSMFEYTQGQPAIVQGSF
jgi:hypothetical protein